MNKKRRAVSLPTNPNKSKLFAFLIVQRFPKQQLRIDRQSLNYGLQGFGLQGFEPGGLFPILQSDQRNPTDVCSPGQRFLGQSSGLSEPTHPFAKRLSP